ncbi:hypothetical protein [Deinococcus roseus]|uniref:PD(D/E)XK endonuclease domain-containing protein n=1 Tax=Deinococcus roseus TaxID=392414 RepID=A0ABQ2CWR8_9DEIO|nr:hypothetical protein [Deinococcus roseus]GGJ23567.1 hypothetical protein GCM10008938_07170 [Deinococcus roseus]
MKATSSLSAARILEGHRLGLLDRELAVYAEVSLATVKRYRSKLGLSANCTRNQLGQTGEAFLKQEAEHRGLHAEASISGAAFDLRIDGLRVEVKTSETKQGEAFRFRLQEKRVSHYGQYQYTKSYQEDCDVLALVCMDQETGETTVYFIESQFAPHDIRIKPNDPTCVYHAFKDDWGLFA